ncbi:MAG TPA: 4-(cytidine 5'-diphospho)-2-C-methyl-D-erythritol kinase [Rhizobiales bacterium]|nr:4-(cytidine 5'-diphospho)-2-C-methyl-D-erythritol kinase [Hyphomicrobiales bacterium]
MSRQPVDGVDLLARAKINLALHVTGRRGDGYHLLDSLVVFADVGDKLHLEPAKQTSLEISGPFAAGLNVDDNNLVLQAFHKLSAALPAPLPATAFHLQKNLPISSGIGGGSADAAAALNGLIDLWQIEIEPEALSAIALSLGADVPVCLAGKTCRMGGVGEELTCIENFPAINCVLVNPGVGVSTPDVFKALALPADEPAFSPLPDLPDDDWINWLTKTRNDLQPAAITQTPQIQQTVNALTQTNNCQLARMSGSGATCFGLYDSRQDAEDAAAMIADVHPYWWVNATRIGYRN